MKIKIQDYTVHIKQRENGFSASFFKDGALIRGTIFQRLPNMEQLKAFLQNKEYWEEEDWVNHIREEGFSNITFADFKRALKSKRDGEMITYLFDGKEIARYNIYSDFNQTHLRKWYNQKVEDDSYQIDFQTFAKQPPGRLWGHIQHNGTVKFGQFKPEWDRYTNSLMYTYHTEKGNKGSGGFTMKKAFELYKMNKLSTHKPELI